MLNFSYLKITFIAAVCLFAVIFSLPNFMGDKKVGFLPDSRVNLGLDLQGGSYLLLEVDFKTYLKEDLQSVASEIRTVFRDEKVNGERIGYTGGINVIGEKIVFELTDPSIAPEVTTIIKEVSSELEVTNTEGKVSVGYNKNALEQMLKKVMDQSIEIVRRRVDETGTREPDIQRQGDNRILLQVPGLSDPENLKEILGKTAKLTFHLLDDSLPYPDTTRGPVPPGTKRLYSEDGTAAFAVKNRILLTGELLTGASSSFDQFGRPAVNLTFNSLGAKKFAGITKENLKKPFAIVLDGKVLTAPQIQSVILDGKPQITGNFTTREASNLALLLRAGALPAELKIVEERTVGPSLGADSIAAGKKAIAVGIVLVIVFMFVSYGLFGLFSDIALILNMVLILAVISVFGATLTLPGIAGIVLTMGMAVDANVLIFERIREEISNGKTPFAAVDNGFQQAFKTIIDSNTTTLIAALLLYIFGSGPIKGFAVTLSVGILASMFSAILLTRLMVVTWLKKKRPTKLAF
ncbi:MAG: protein translocase subunit SecD [Rickettsiales bacterium]|nr:protein translocase subunit SecD [Pseudomonadota bacterium]MDA0965541.1 protein translocase subunit SecD [Pseudomonadota bacterium]MDG4542865.1 protein translocase subunit SecD [Rickettsiales bacterium]MDG4544687.1 protein translocase subunit SecD [Rickettsiales bacterium]MDG4546809.1 protein translocase subunit SecD [Rickettsiales bacterium]